MKIKQMIRTMLCTTMVLLSVTGTAFAASDTDNIVEETEQEEAYRITFDGKSYSLPCDVAEFEKNGWKLEGYDVDKKIPGLTYSGIELSKGGKAIRVNLLNDRTDATALKDCKVASITVETDRPSFTTSKGVKVGSTVDEVKKAHGNETFEQPYSTDSKTETIWYRYRTKELPV